MNEHMNDGAADKASARRRLIRGAFTAPAVLTLYSGSALAQTSSQCVAGWANATTDNLVVENAEFDNFLRYQLWALVNAQGTAQSYYIQGSDLVSMVTVAGFSPGIGQWQQFDITTGKVTGAIISSQPNGANLTFTRVNKYVVLRVDSAGSITSVGDGPGQLLGRSCWGSIRGIPG